MAATLTDKFNEIDRRDGWMLLFAALRQESAKSMPSFNDAKSALNARLNRYRDILPFDHSRVRLGDGGYINASHTPIPKADRSYILTQGPLAHTTGDFWQMVWEQKSRAIVMLNRIMEKGQVKCHPYYPTLEQSGGHQYGDYQLELVDERTTKHYVLRTIRLSNSQSDDRRLITHFQFVTWPDFGVPESTSDFLEFLLEVRKSGLLKKGSHGPPIVHCSAGVGRSGTFVIADAALVIAGKTKDPSKVDIVRMVLELRYFRMGLIQTYEQLRFSWKAVVDALEDDRWKELVEDGDGRGSEEAGSNAKRPSLKRLSGNQLTDDSDHTETGSEEDEQAGSSAQLKDSDKSPKRPRPDIAGQGDTCKPHPAALEGTPAGDHPAPGSGDDYGAQAIERYRSRLRRRQERALNVQQKIDQIHRNLRRSNPSSPGRYQTWLYGGAAAAVLGGLLVYLYGRWAY